MFLLKIEFKKVQTFLFAAPRLRDMVGANVQLGEAIRVKLVKELSLFRNGQLPKFDVNHENLPLFDQDDPIESSSGQPLLRDTPREMWDKYGVLARDGGHFHAVFEESEQACGFGERAVGMIANEMPGLLVEARVVDLQKNKEDKSDKGSLRQCQGVGVVDIPQFQVCQETGQGPATSQYGKQYIGAALNKRRLAYDRFREPRPSAEDIVSNLSGLPLMDLCAPQDFSELSKNGYIAVIHADGNAVGKRYKEFVGTEKGLSGEMKGEHFFHRMRVGVRKAVVGALNEVLGSLDALPQVRPYQLLMLGGDDLLLVCDALYALPFVKAYANHLMKYRLLGKDGLPSGAPLTIGAGVVIAKHKFPFYQLHRLAEDLASSAKRLSRCADGDPIGSVVDWRVISNPWAEDVEQYRNRTEVVQYSLSNGCNETLALSSKPYPIFEQDGQSRWCLEAILEDADKLNQSIRQGGGAARSQLRFLVEQLRLGRRQAQRVFEDLAQGTFTLLSEVMGEDVWKNEGENFFKTRLGDLIEVMEISRLGKSQEADSSRVGGE